jgi:hypothetical protein
MLGQDLNHAKEEIKNGGRKEETTVQQAKAIFVDGRNQKRIEKDTEDGADQAGEPEDVAVREFVVRDRLGLAIHLEICG